MAVNPRSAPTDFPPPVLAGPTVPTRAPTTQLSSIQSHVHPGTAGGSSQLVLADPSATVMLRPLQQAHSGEGALGIEYVSCVPEISVESQLGTGQIEASQGQKLLDPALTAEIKSIEKVQSLILQIIINQ